MAQSSFYLPQETLSSPTPKRSRLSLKQSKLLLQEPPFSAVYFEPKQDSGSQCAKENEDHVPSDICSVQDENASPNCSILQPKQLLFSTVSNLEEISDKIYAPGLPNCGNTCYANSILQVLRYTPNFLSCVHLILSSHTQLAQVPSISSEVLKETEFFIKLHTLYIAMRKQEILSKNVDKDFSGSLLKPVKSFLLSLREVSSTFEEGEQHDAHELLFTIIFTFSSFYQNIKDKISAHSQSQSSQSSSILDNDSAMVCHPDKEPKRPKARLKRRQKSSSPTQSENFSNVSFSCKNVEELDLGFEGKIRHCIKCLECEKRLERTELFTNLDVPIADSLVSEDTVNLIECLIQRTILCGDNKYFCEDCYHLSEAEISSEVILLPSILLLHCSWLRQSSDMTEIEKDCTKVLIPMSLKTSDNTEIFCCAQDETYILYAIVLHLGMSTEGGHYVSFVRDASPKSIPDGEKPLNNVDHNSNLCCTTAEILNFKLSNTTVNRWLLFDDETVTSVYVDESTENFPYFDFLGITATPCMIFYYKL